MKLYHKLTLAVLAMLLFTLTAQATVYSVDCRPNSKGLPTITAAVAKIAAKAAKYPLGPNTILVTGPCVENVTISRLDNVTLQAGPLGASITDASNGTQDTLDVADSNRFALNGFTINGSVNCFENSVCRLSGNTIQNSQVGFGLRAGRAHLVSQSDSIINNPSGAGVVVTNGSRAVFVDDNVSNNGGHGIQVFSAALVIVSGSASTTTISNNGGHGILATDNGTARVQIANITGNAGDGVRVRNGSVMRTDFVGPSMNNITGNAGAGVNLGDLAHAFFANDGSTNITGNLGGLDVYCAGQFAATRNVASVGGTTNCVEPNPDSPKRK